MTLRVKLARMIDLSNPYVRLMRIDKPIGFLLLLWPTYWGLWLASESGPSIKNLIIFTLGVFLMRSAGCVINDYADRNFDAHVTRTNQRPLATGELQASQALKLFALLIAIAAALVLLTNLLTIQLAFAAVALATLYPFMKRYTHLPQVVLGAAFSMSIPMAFAAEVNHIAPSVWLVYLTNLVWTVCYDTLYGAVDKPDDEKIGIKSTAILFGKHLHLAITCLQILTLLGLVLMQQWFELSVLFTTSLVVVSVLMMHQQWLMRRPEPLYFRAFYLNHWVGFTVLIGIIADQAFS